MTTHLSLPFDVLSWSATRETSSLAEDPDWKKPYQYWKHADHLLTHEGDEHYRIDCIANLKRAVDHRLKRLNSLYQFKKISDPRKPSELLETLGYLGIARPAMLLEISALRNFLEHQYKAPPSTTRCQEFVEFIWYFLRSTDALSTSVVDTFVLDLDGENGDGAFWLAVTYGPSVNWACSVRGWIPAEFANETSGGDVTLNLKNVESREQFSAKRAGLAELVPPPPNRSATDIYLSGEVVGGPEAFSKLTEIYFSIL
jgi:hypothetical protein